MTTAPLASSPADVTRLRRALLANGMFSTACGLAFLLAARPITATLGNLPPWVVPAVGTVLLLFAMCVLLVARGLPETAPAVAQIIAADLAWVAGSVALLLGRPSALESTGLWLIFDVALVVAVLALFQLLGLRRLRS